ncbi:hypothetical protein BC941DRAFT_424443 [Chlamydoabsidia padenii]|nr:hypothetical protein BC941DRAFT_424443 [Chlamydoabsidia padenii]
MDAKMTETQTSYDSPRRNRTTVSGINSSSSTTTANITTCFDQLTPTLIALKERFETMNQRLEELKTIDDSLSKFNDAFGAFLFGLSANGETTRWPLEFEQQVYEIQQQQQQPKKQQQQQEQQQQEQQQKQPSTETIVTTETDDNKPTVAQPAPLKKNKTKFVKKVNIRKIIDRLPLKFREQTEPMKTMETTLRVLRLQPNGMTMDTIVHQIGLPKYRVTECLNALVRSKDVVKHNPKGQMAIYQLDPSRYPSY